MTDRTMTTSSEQGLVQVWITVTDAAGTSRLESRWTSAADAPHATHAA